VVEALKQRKVQFRGLVCLFVYGMLMDGICRGL
jgi:hypothetical protein